MKRGHIPIRTCRGCCRKFPKSELVRLVMVNGAVLEDPEKRLSGRAVYSCRNEQCRTRLEKNKKTLKRFLRLQVG